MSEKKMNQLRINERTLKKTLYFEVIIGKTPPRINRKLHRSKNKNETKRMCETVMRSEGRWAITGRLEERTEQERN